MIKSSIFIPTDYLKHQHPEAENIRFYGEESINSVLGGHVTAAGTNEEISYYLMFDQEK